MKLLVISRLMLAAPWAVLLCAQTPPKPAAPAPKPSAPAPAGQAVTAAPAAALPPETVVLVVGEEKMTKADFEALMEGLPEQVRKSVAGVGIRKMADDLANLKSLAREARRRKLEQTVIARQMMELQQDQVLANVLVKQLQSNMKTDDAAVKAWYEAHKGEYEQVKASHILIRYKGSQLPLREGQKDLTEAEALAKAQEIRKRLLAGEDFAKVAKAESDDSGSGANGGSLGSFTKGRMVPAFEQAAFSQAAGHISEPVKTQFGYHIIKVEEHTSKTLDEVRPQIEQQIKPQLTQKAVDEIRNATQVVINEQYFGPAPAK
ncbi:MAG: peptidyl-prolyl cis-trans isomerase [Acidobacteriota bacterium]|nr:peptidyl-prolyl cis-trans isomerase [Acidobacteriota bacterium]